MPQNASKCPKMPPKCPKTSQNAIKMIVGILQSYLNPNPGFKDFVITTPGMLALK
jgi:hypothetical protein